MNVEELMRKVEVERPEMRPERKVRKARKRPEPMVSGVSEPASLDIMPPTQLKAEEKARGTTREVQLKPPVFGLPDTSGVSQADLEQLRKDIAENIVNFEAMMFKGFTDKEMTKAEYGSLYRPIKMGMDIMIKDVNLVAWMVVLMILTSQLAFVGMHWGDIQEGIDRRKGRGKKKVADAPPAEAPPAVEKERKLRMVV